MPMIQICPHCKKLKSAEHMQQCNEKQFIAGMIHCSMCNATTASLKNKRGYQTYACQTCRNEWIA